MLWYAPGLRPIRARLTATSRPPMGTRLVQSLPPAKTTSFMPLATECTPCTITCSPLAQKRLMVAPATLSGRLAIWAAMRAML